MNAAGAHRYARRMGGIAVEWCVGARELSEPRLSPDGSLLGVVVTEQGATHLDVHRIIGGGGVRRLVEHPAPRAGRGLGGGCWTWAGEAIVYAAVDGNLWSQPLAGGTPRRLTDHGPDRAAQAPVIAPDGTCVVYVVDQAEVWCVDLQPPAAGLASLPAARRLDSGTADFCFDPVVLADGRSVLWQAWNVPDMPWDGARLEGVDLVSGERRRIVVGGAVQQPRAMPGGGVACVRDDSGWANVWVDGAPLVVDEHEHAGPSWGLGQRSFACSPDGRHVAFTRNERGFGRLCVSTIGTGTVVEVARGVHGQLSWCGPHLAAVRTGARTPTQVVVYDVPASPGDPDATWHRRTIEVGPDPCWNDAPLVEPEAVELVAADGSVVHARLYRADDDRADGRLICWIHGGPTDQWQVTFLPRIAYWRSLGWHVLVPDHRGSTGHGRAYQQALRGGWGDLDVADVLVALRAACDRGWARPERTVLIGGSAGGFTALGVLARLADDDPLVAAAVVAYPVSDLDDLAERSHRFERHYTDSLVAPAGSPLMSERSPVAFAHRIRRPLLVFHGVDDPVVPIDQSRVLVERLRTAGCDVELIEFPGEGHGFRDRAHQLDEYAHTAAFLNRHVH